MLDLSAQSIDISRYVSLHAGKCVKITITAPAATKRNMKIQAEIFHFRLEYHNLVHQQRMIVRTQKNRSVSISLEKIL